MRTDANTVLRERLLRVRVCSNYFLKCRARVRVGMQLNVDSRASAVLRQVENTVQL